MLKTDETPPAEINEAAEKVARWFAEHNVTDWVLGRCASRGFAEQAIESDANKYDRLLKLIQYYVQVMWLVFGAFLLAETVLLGAVASIAKKGSHGFMFGAALLGLLLILPWVDLVSLQPRALPATCS